MFRSKNLSKNFPQQSAGFTFIEVIITLFVVLVGVAGVLAVMGNIFSAITDSTSRLTAAHLAKEGMEVVRNIRDTNWTTSGAVWDDNLLCAFSPCEWEADYTTRSFNSDCSSGSYHNCDTYDGDYLLLSAGGFYNYGSGSETKYKRKVIIDQVDGNTLNIKVEVSWSDEQPPFVVESNIYNWR